MANRKKDGVEELEDEVQSLLKKLAKKTASAQPIADVPPSVKSAQVESQISGAAYAEANWAKLSPAYRAAHNKLRVQRGMAPIPEPKVDLWEPPRGGKISKFDPNDPEARGAMREFLGPRLLVPGGEGFEDRGSSAAAWLDPELRISRPLVVRGRRE
jgi:hypothetical protein